MLNCATKVILFLKVSYYEKELHHFLKYFLRFCLFSKKYLYLCRTTKGASYF